MSHIVKQILNELNDLSERINPEELDSMAELLYTTHKNGGRVFLAGAGRSGCVVKAFTNRLMHCGLTVYLLGDITTPPIKENDLLFALSGSGMTTQLINYANKAISCGAKVATITLQKEGTIGKMASAMVLLPGTTRFNDDTGTVSIQPIGNCFEQLAWLTCDGIVILLKNKLGLTNEDLIAHHANLE